ncbi:DUF6089 family protein [Arcicella sp. DC2W]|uniref:DUF6089 family protein n=1 Tax=Arcicella gelida TaxID=2984195 RepID=A0ABU5RZL4_9BACT|nr:DUF6089 family protein [Arcicella sp. DC2W]MEA5401648.1 DUF6089 family protein [Arcicella sp. DC2W]
MNFHQMYIKNVYIILLTSCLSFKVFSQKKLFEKHSDIAFGIGTANYYGDVVPINRPIQSTLRNIRWNVSVDLTRHFTPRFSGNVALTWVRIAGDDNELEGIPLQETTFMRNTHFRNDIQELSIKGIFHIIPENRNYHKRSILSPYIFAGLAVIHHNPIAKVPLDFVGSEAIAGEWVSLQPLRTEGQGLVGYSETPYNLFAVNIPFGAGVKYKINRKFDLGFEVGLRYSFTDYLDDIGGNYANYNDLIAVSPLAAAMGHREYELIAANSGKNREAAIRQYLATNVNPAYANPALTPTSTFPEIFGKGSTRNGASRLDDIYLLTTFKLIYHIAPQIKCPVIQ